MNKLAVIAVAALVALPATVLASPPELPEQAAERVAEARANAKDKAEQFANEKARGRDENKSTGLARAAEVSNSWRFTGADKPGNGVGQGNGNTDNPGKALGAGRAAAVHEALANGESPSDLPSHGEAVSAVAREMGGAYEAMKAKPADHPGKGEGKGLGGPGGDDDADD